MRTLTLIVFLTAACAACITVEDNEPDVNVVVHDDDGEGCDGGVPETDAAPDPDASPDASPDAPPDASPSAGIMTYTLAPDDTESEARIVVGGTTAVLAKFRFTAQHDSLKLTKVRFRLTDVAFDPSVPHGVNSLSLYDGSTLVAGPVPPNGSGYADFSSFAFVVPQDGSKTLTVKAALNQVGPVGADTGIDVGVTLCAGNNDGPCWTGGPEPMEDGTYEVRSATSDVVVDTIGPYNIQGRTKILRKTKPTVSLASPPNSVLTNGTRIVSRFTVTADAAGMVSVKSLAFEVALHDNGGAWLAVWYPSIREVGMGTDLPTTNSAVGCTTGPTPELANGNCLFHMPFANEQIIAAGQSKTYELRITVSGADVSGESISTKLLGDTGRITGSIGTQGDMITGSSALHRFIWSDNSKIPHSDLPSGSADWTNGHLVRGLPTDTQTLVAN